MIINVKHNYYRGNDPWAENYVWEDAVVVWYIGDYEKQITFISPMRHAPFMPYDFRR